MVVSQRRCFAPVVLDIAVVAAAALAEATVVAVVPEAIHPVASVGVPAGALVAEAVAHIAAEAPAVGLGEVVPSAAVH